MQNLVNFIKNLLDNGDRIPEKRKKVLIVRYIILLVLYITAVLCVSTVSRLNKTVLFFGTEVSVSIFAGVLSSIANICIFLFVVFFGKIGFITAVVLLLTQFPMLIVNVFVRHNPGNIPGIFTSVFTTIAVILMYTSNRQLKQYQKDEVENLISRQKFSQRLFEQTATALVNAIDAKDTYSHGHSLRVAEYSEKIARMLGKDDEECQKIYYAALLHDVGKIGVSNDIINKKGRLTDEEFAEMKQHPVMGNQILSSITEYPYLSIGAHYHHERYDGRGYPEGLKGEDIPEIARIISVADAYDAMSSSRSYRDAIPQQLVREEIVKGAGTQFDPEFARIMQHLIDLDTEYTMKEKNNVNELAGKNTLILEEHRSDVSDGILVQQSITRLHLKADADIKTDDAGKYASIILFDSLDGRVHDDKTTARDLNYFEYGEIWFDGHAVNEGVREISSRTEIKRNAPAKKDPCVFDIEAVRVDDHAQIKINDGSKVTEITVALPDSSRYLYIALTGERCSISDVRISRDDENVPPDYIPRIAEKISYIGGKAGNIPNVQIDGQRTAATEGVPIDGKMKVGFHTMSLPTARLVWHCPYIVIFTSKDGKVNGEDYREYALIRLDGENNIQNPHVDNRMILNKLDEFAGWDNWKAENKKGYDCEAVIVRQGSRITTTTENFGLQIKNITTVLDDVEDLYFALTGDQCAITGINVTKTGDNE